MLLLSTAKSHCFNFMKTCYVLAPLDMKILSWPCDLDLDSIS